MREDQIAPGRWEAFGERFSRHHQDWRCLVYQLHTTDRVPNDRTQCDLAPLFDGERPLQEIRATDRTHEVIVTVGRDRAETSYLIEEVVSILCRESDNGLHELRIESRSGASTLIQLQPRREQA
jgi:hypothetical protein